MGKQKKEYAVFRKIIEKSNSPSYDEAIKEWGFKPELSYYIENDGEEEQCVCGKEGIKEINIAVHKETGEQIILGSQCVKRVFNVDVDKTIFNSIKILKKNIKASISKHALKYLLEEQIISDDYYMEYLKLRNKKSSMLEKDITSKVEFNDRFLKFYASPNKEIRDKISTILIWAKTNPVFQCGYIVKYQQDLFKYGHLFDDKIATINKVIKGWGVPVTFEDK